MNLSAGCGLASEYGIQAVVLLFCKQSIFVDPTSQFREESRIQVNWSALGLTSTGHQVRLFKNLNVLRDALDGHLERFGEFIYGGRSGGEPDYDLPPCLVPKGQERPIEIFIVKRHVFNSFLYQPFG